MKTQSLVQPLLLSTQQQRQSQELDIEVASMIEMAETASTSSPITSHKQEVQIGNENLPQTSHCSMCVWE